MPTVREYMFHPLTASMIAVLAVITTIAIILLINRWRRRGVIKDNVFTARVLIIAVTLIEWCTFLYQDSTPDPSYWDIVYVTVTFLTIITLYLRIGITANTTKVYLSRVLMLFIGSVGLYSLTSIVTQTSFPNSNLLVALVVILLAVSLGKTFQPNKHSSTSVITRNIPGNGQRFASRLLAINILVLFSICTLDILRLSMWSVPYVITIGAVLTVFIGWLSHSAKALAFQSSVLLLSVLLSALLLDLYRPGTDVYHDFYLHIGTGLIFFVFPLCIGKFIRIFSLRKMNNLHDLPINRKTMGQVLFIATTIMSLAIWPISIISPGSVYPGVIYLFCVFLHFVIATTPVSGKGFLFRIAILSSTASFGLGSSINFDQIPAMMVGFFFATAVFMGLARLVSIFLSDMNIERFFLRNHSSS